MKTQAAGWTLIAVALFLAMQSVADDIASLQNFQGWYSNTQFIASVLKHLGTVGMSILGGIALPFNLSPPKKEPTNG